MTKDKDDTSKETKETVKLSNKPVKDSKPEKPVLLPKKEKGHLPITKEQEKGSKVSKESK
eukprot:CAMPEP_0170533938 /NCGR_PEP_ID=MMETSP0209-20121228/86444_1 /TAXON_ID=665100 ORGANISM="Litonotus pictus, Strain P1" /NCGR_SAMPLE_ID=MMETSP0209 /ASSEMBLY_ACC=CAM_ASM_000301 /LENGTH=59 /DNA_ID=CAMNT_0010832429 /DNA_START=83 /DNA_END=259 /DNA_ORIENTATION=+